MVGENMRVCKLCRRPAGVPCFRVGHSAEATRTSSPKAAGAASAWAGMAKWPNAKLIVGKWGVLLLPAQAAALAPALFEVRERNTVFPLPFDQRLMPLPAVLQSSYLNLSSWEIKNGNVLMHQGSKVTALVTAQGNEICKPPPLPCVSTVFVAKAPPFALCSTVFVAKAPPLPCVSTSLWLRHRLLPCVSTVFVAKAPPFALCFHCLLWLRHRLLPCCPLRQGVDGWRDGPEGHDRCPRQGQGETVPFCRDSTASIGAKTVPFVAVSSSSCPTQCLFDAVCLSIR